MAHVIETISSWLFPLIATIIILVVQWMFWFPSISSTSEDTSTSPDESCYDEIRARGSKESAASDTTVSSTAETSFVASMPTKRNEETKERNDKDHQNESGDNDDDENNEDLSQMNDQWRCACEGGFLPPGLLKSFGGAEAMMRLGTGQCYHKQL